MKNNRAKKNHNQQIKTQKSYYYNEHDENQVEQLRNRRKKRKIKKGLVRLFKIFIVVLIILFFVSPLSRVKKITVSGLHFISETTILENTGISENSIHVFTYSYFIEKKLLALPMVASVDIHRGFFNGITIDVKERQVIAYELTNDTLFIIDDKGQRVQTDSSLLKEVQQLPRLLGFENEEIRKNFCEQLAKVPSSTLSLMSDIVFNPIEPYDKTRVQIDMSDGKKVYVRIDNMANGLKYYQEILSKEPNACVYDVEGNKVYASPCP